MKIITSGLCLFVPKQEASDPNERRMHILLPVMPGHHHAPGDEHVPVLSVDTAHLRPNSTKSDGVMARIKLSGFQLAIPDEATATADLSLCPEIVDLKPVSGPLDPDSVPTNRLAAHVVFGAGGKGRVARGAGWEWDDPKGLPRPLAHRLEWIIDGLAGPHLDLRLENLDSAGGMDLPSLYPFTTGDFIQLFLDHVPASELEFPPDPDQQEEPPARSAPPHFHAFFGLFDPAVPTLLPRYRVRECADIQVCEPIVDSGGSPFSCMVARVGP